MEKVDFIRLKFVQELHNEGDYWRLLRRKTLVDLIKLAFSKYELSRQDGDLVEIINLGLKIKILEHLQEISLSKDIEETLTQFNQQKDEIMHFYDQALLKISHKDINHSTSQKYDLNNEVQYLKVLNLLEFSNYSVDVFDELLQTAYNLLPEKISCQQ